MGVFIISPSEKGGKLFDPSAKLVDLCQPLTPMAFNDLFCLARSEVNTLSVGAARLEDFDAHVEALQHFDSARETIAPIEQRLRGAMAEVLGDDWEQLWQDGIPVYSEMPGDINAREILRLWSWAKGLDMLAFAKMRYQVLGNAEHWFPGEKATDFDDAEVLAAVRASPRAKEIPGLLRQAHELLYEGEAKRLSQSE